MKSLKLSLALAGLLLAGAAQAVTVYSYSVTGATLLNGAAFSGSWTYDQTTKAVTNFSFTFGAGTANASSTISTPADTFTSAAYDQMYGTNIGLWAKSANGNGLILSFDPKTGALGSNTALNTGTYYFTYMSNAGTATVTAVPEPSSYALLLTGIGAIGFVARRRSAGAVQA